MQLRLEAKFSFVALYSTVKWQIVFMMNTYIVYDV